jgi:aldose 1-epimerase
MKITERDFGQEFKKITLENKQGVKLSVTDLGARIVALEVPTEAGEKNIVLGFDSAQEYLEKDTYIGATIGRVAGRITGGKFTIDGKEYQAKVDEKSGHTLHGGVPGFEEKKWAYTTSIEETSATVDFSILSPADENGFPGNLTVHVRYTLDDENVWTVAYSATSDASTLFNPTNHVYFNLTGDVSVPVDEHRLKIAADFFAPIHPDGTVTGEKRAVAGTSFDFSTPRKLKETFASNEEQKELVDGIDHPFFLNESAKGDVVATLESPTKNILVEVMTEEPAVVIFTANFGENVPEMHGKTMANHGGITFETQVAPGAVEFEDFGNILLPKGEEFTSETKYKINFK